MTSWLWLVESSRLVLKWEDGVGVVGGVAVGVGVWELEFTGEFTGCSG